jgi:hypothetical protein
VNAEAAASALQAVEEFLARFVAFPTEHARVATALWVGHTYLIDEFDSTPRLAFLSPEPGSGKTRALEVIGSLVRRPMHAVNATPAALFRSCGDAENRPTILFDEVDTVFGPKAKDNEDLRGFLNAGHRRSGVTYRCEGMGTAQRVVAFPSYAAVALAGLHDLPGTIGTRSVVVRMRRRGPSEVVSPYQLRVHEPAGLAMGEHLASALTGVHLPEDPVLPAGVSDRPADVWEPLLAVAQGAGGVWPARAAAACSHFVTGADAGTPSLSSILLADVRCVFRGADDPEGLPSARILAELAALEESPWATLRGRGLDAASLARLLRGYEVRSANLRVGGQVVKGYRRADLADAWSRYLPPQADHEQLLDAACASREGATPATAATRPPSSPTTCVLSRDDAASDGVADSGDQPATHEVLAATSPLGAEERP